MTLPAWTNCRITIGEAKQKEFTHSGEMEITLSDLALDVTQVMVEVRRQNATAWGTPLTLTPTRDGRKGIVVIPSLYNGLYHVRASYIKGNTTCWDIYGGENSPTVVSITDGQDVPNPCLLAVSGVGYAPSRAGVNDGKVTVLLDQTQGRDVTLRLMQGSTVMYEKTAEQTDPARPDPYHFDMTGILPGIYDLDARISNACVSAAADDVTVDPPELQIGDQLTFIPWLQPTLAHAADGTQGLRPTLSLSTKLRTDNGTPETIDGPKAEIYGPGDVLGIAQRALLTTSPAPGAVGFSPLQLAFVDFQEEDLPWRYSTLKAGDDPLPWVMLLVLETSEFTPLQLAGQPLPGIKVKGSASGAYPSRVAEQQKLWAHVQINATLGDNTGDDGKLAQPGRDEIDRFLTTQLPRHPDLAYSRVLCPRRLAENTEYHAFLVPAVEAGRLTGLGSEFAAGDLAISSLPAVGTTADRSFPVYYQWKFSTGSEDDFESLVQQLHQANDTTRTAPAPTLAFATDSTTYQLPLASALVDAEATAPTVSLGPAAAQVVAQYLYDHTQPRRSASGRPLVSAPLYGRAYFVTPGLADPSAGLETSWKHTLNLDPRYRALAAIGTEVVRDNQEEYVRRAWEQAQDILLANERLRGAQYGLRTTAGLRDQHLPVNTTVTTTTTSGGSNRLAASRLAEPADQEDGAGTAAKANQANETQLAAKSDQTDGAELAAKNDQAAEAGTTEPQTTRSTGLADYGLHLTGMAMRRVRVSEATRAAAAQANPDAPALPRVTVHEAIRRSNVPLAAFSPAFRRISKPFGNFQVGQAGRPLRPTQPEEVADASDLRTPGTSLRQRDALLTQLSQGELAAAPDHGEVLRAYQFNDKLVDDYLKASIPGEGNSDPITITSPTVGGDFAAAFSAFATQAVDPTTHVVTAVGFRKPQYVRPSLPLSFIKSDLVEGTKPGPVFIKKIETVAPSLGTTPTQQPTGDFEGTDYNASHYYVGDFDEPGHEEGGDFVSGDFLPADFLVPRMVWDYETAPVADTPPTRAPEPEQMEARDESASAANQAEDPDQPARGEQAARPATFARAAFAAAKDASTTTTTTTAEAPATDANIPVIKQAKVFPVFKEAMGEALRQRHPELFVPGLSDFAAGGVAVLDVNSAFVEAYLAGLNHALGSELHWRGFPVDLRGTFFQQFWDVSEHFNATLPAGTPPTAEQEAAWLDIKPLDQWGANKLGSNAVQAAQAGTATLRVAMRSELLRRYPTLVVALQDDSAPLAQGTTDYTDPANYLHPLQRLPVGQDLVVVTFDVSLTHAIDHCALVLMERPGQPKFGLDAEEPGQDYTTDPVSWNDLTWAYTGTTPGGYFTPTTSGALHSKPHAAAEPESVAYLTDSSTVAYALFQEPILAVLPIKNFLSV